MENLNSAVETLIHGANTLFILMGAIMVLAMSTISGAILVLYATTLEKTVPNAVGHMISASLISLPAALLLASALQRLLARVLGVVRRLLATRCLGSRRVRLSSCIRRALGTERSVRRRPVRGMRAWRRSGTGCPRWLWRIRELGGLFQRCG